MNKMQGKITIVPTTQIKGSIKSSMIYPALEDLTIKPSLEEQHFKSDKYGYDNVTVEAITLEETTVKPSTESVEVVANEGYDGLSKVTVAGDSNLLGSNIKKGATIFEVEGEYEGIDTSDSTAVEADLLEGKTAYNANGKVVGTMANNGDINIVPEVANKVTKPAGYYSSIEVEAVEKTDLYTDCKELTGDILSGASLVPDTFEQLEYIESTGEQYIKLSDWYDTKLSTTNFYDIVADVQFTILPSEYDDKWHLNGVGSYTGTTILNKYDTLLYFGYSYVDEGHAQPYFCYSPSLKNTDCVTTRPLDTERHTFKVISNANKAEAGFWIDDEHVEARGSTLATKKFGYPFYIFGYENDSGVIGNKQKVHRFQLLNDDGSLFYDLIPARRKEDNAIGLYDTVKGTFYTNNGTGEFLYETIESDSQGSLQEDLQEILNVKNEKIIPSNIKKDVEILGVVGELEGTAETNVFMQETEPEKKDGIWLQGNYEVENIIADTNVFASEEWNTVKTDNLKEMPYSFSGGRCASIGTDIYLFGHSSGNYAYKYNSLTDTYTKLTDVPYTFYLGSAVAVGTNIYLFGSNVSDYGLYAYKYDTLTDTYTRLTDIPTKFYSQGVAAIGTDIYLFAPYVNSTNTNRYPYKYNTLNDTYTQLKTIPYKFTGGRCATVGGNIYLFGGSGGDTNAYRYNVSENTYTKLTAIPTGLQNGACIAVGTNIYLFGYSNTTYGKQAYKYDTLTDTYTALPNIINNFNNQDLAFNGTDIYLFGVQNYNTKPQVMTMIPKEFPNKSIVISQGGTNHHGTNLADVGIPNLKTFYDRVYYRDNNGELLNSIPTYNGNGTEWTRI